MTDFIKEQQELARNYVLNPEVSFQSNLTIMHTFSDKGLDTLIAQITTNIGKELLRRIEETDNTFSFTDSRYIKKDTMKQHITSVTGAYE